MEGVALVLSLINLAVLFFLARRLKGEWLVMVPLEFKYVAIHPDHSTTEFVGEIWINGAVDWNNRPFFFRRGCRVTITCPEYVEVCGRKYKFAFWQREKPPLSLTFQGVIDTSRDLEIVVHEKEIWWANYAPAE